MPSLFTEDTYEQAIIELFENMGYDHLYAPDMDRDYSSSLLDELDLTAAESKATYDEIKAYALEHTGLKVSSLYISQIKRKCGLDVGQNYNLSKKEDAKVPQCHPEKEKAIMEALKHFGMIL